MNVSGLRSRTRRKSISHSATRPSNLRVNFAPEPPAASRSMTSKPMLCRVPSYLLPGLPRPTTSFLMGRAAAAAGPGSLLLLVLGLAADHLGLARAADDRARLLGLAGAGGDLDQEQVGVGLDGEPL